MRHPSRARSSLCLALMVAASIGLPPISVAAAALPTVASINVCTDQLLMALADPQQILGLSPYARDATSSWDAAKAAQFRRLSGGAEDVLALRPDVVVTSRFSNRTTRDLLTDKGLQVAAFDLALTLDDTKRQLRAMGDIVGHPDRAAAEIAKLDAAQAQLRAAAARHPARVLVLSRRGWVSGRDSITNALLAAAGLHNAADELGLAASGFASLEQIVASKPDYLVVTDGGTVAEDEGSAFLLHPALQQLYPPSKRMVIPDRLTVCGGPMLAQAMQRLASEIVRVVH